LKDPCLTGDDVRLRSATSETGLLLIYAKAENPSRLILMRIGYTVHSLVRHPDQARSGCGIHGIGAGLNLIFEIVAAIQALH